MAMIGMDPDLVENVGRQLKKESDDIHTVIGAVDGLVNQAEAAWKGPDATKFKTEWDGTHKPNLTRVQQAVAELSTGAIRQAGQQRSTSAS